jgi:hypothetical protein
MRLAKPHCAVQSASTLRPTRGIIAAVRLTSTSMKFEKQRYFLTSLSNENSIFAGTGIASLHYSYVFQFRL